jgi:thioredoxin reductase (NADPH)
VENFPGFPEGINGFDLADAMRRQAERFGAELRYEAVQSLKPNDDGTWTVTTDAGAVSAGAVIATAGAEYNRLAVPGELEYTGRGVSYCATCDGAFFKGGRVAVVGGGNAAMDEAVFLTRFAASITVIHRRDSLRADKILQQRAFAQPSINFRWNTTVEAIHGDATVVRELELRDVVSGERSQLAVDGIFIFIGQTPNSHLLHGLVEMDEGGHAIVDLEMRTSAPGLFVAGDLRTRAARQLVSAAGDGATAAIAAERYLAARQATAATDRTAVVH